MPGMKQIWFPLLLSLSVPLLSLAAGPPETERILDETNSWAFDPPDDSFSVGALLDLRGLNEIRSGQSGFVRLSDDGNDFVRGDGEPIRFWAVGTDAWKWTPEEMDTHCRWLAKLGVNLARLHVTVCRKNEGSAITDVDEKVIDGCHRFIKAAKDNGIYVLISPYYAHFEIPESWGIEGGKQNAVGLFFVRPEVQDAYKVWTREFYTRENPHTGLPIAKDPTVAVLQVHNEDSLLFWTSQRIPEPHWKLLSEHFSEWLTEKYGSTAKAWEAWGDGPKGKSPFDDPENGMIGVLRIFDLTRDPNSPAHKKRLDDTTRFLGEYQRDFYESMGNYLRDELGCEQLLNATNWRTANDDRLKALERYTYHALDIESENEYVGSDYQHQGENDHYRVDPGHYLVNESVLPKPFELSTNYKMEEGKAFIVTETAWKNPNRYQSEGPFLVAAYQSLNGLDAICWFSCQSPRYTTDPRKDFWRVGDEMAIHKWEHCYPAMMAGFPANALLFRKGYLTQAEPIVREVRSLESVFEREIPRVTDNEVHGDQRDAPPMRPGWEPEDDEVNPVVFQIGRVVSVLGGDPEETEVGSIDEYFDPEAGTIASSTGELLWNYRKQICTMDAPRAQGVTGFLADNGGTFELSDVIIESGNDYATVNVVPLDDRPLSESEWVLVQVVTVNRMTGYDTEAATFEVGRGDSAYEVEGEQIARIGSPPIRLANSDVSVRFPTNPELTTATALDVNGYPRETVAADDGVFRVPSDAIYLVVESK